MSLFTSCNNYYNRIPAHSLETAGRSFIGSFALHAALLTISSSTGIPGILSLSIHSGIAHATVSLIYAVTTPLFRDMARSNDNKLICVMRVFTSFSVGLLLAKSLGFGVNYKMLQIDSKILIFIKLALLVGINSGKLESLNDSACFV